MVQTRRSARLAASNGALVQNENNENNENDQSADTRIKSASRKRKRSPEQAASRTEKGSFFLKRDVESIAPERGYQDMQVPPTELRPSAVLTTGQCFHWKVVVQGCHHEKEEATKETKSAWGTHNATEWVGVLRVDGASLVLALKETPTTTLYRILHGPNDLNYEKLLKDYFQLHIKLGELYRRWSECDPDRLGRIAPCIPGLRLIEQNPWECLVSFICSSNNNIPRITKMLTAIRQTYGSPLIAIGNETLYSFPSLAELQECATEKDLRNQCGLGYRARYIMETADKLTFMGGESFLQDLRELNDADAVQEKLILFSGVGRKVADCVALFSLRQCNAIPVDVHLWNIARRDYDPEETLKDVKSLTPTIYRQVGEVFRSRFRDKAGWAHSLLFTAELPSFRPVLPQDIVDHMDAFRQFEKEKKTAAKKGTKRKKTATKAANQPDA